MFIYVKHLENNAEKDIHYICFIVSEHKQNLIHFSIPAEVITDIFKPFHNIIIANVCIYMYLKHSKP